MSSLKEKKIKVTITLNGGLSFNENNNTIIFENLKTLCNINFGNGAIMPSANVRIYGLKLENMLSLLRVKWNTSQALQNTIKIEAGEENNLSIVYQGNITFAKPDFSSQPDIFLEIESNTAFLNQVTPAKPRSFDGEIDVATAIETLSKDIGFIFENNGVNKKLQNQYLADSALGQMRAIAKYADIDLYIDNDTIAITNKGEPRTIKTPVISPNTGLIGYPMPDMIGVQFKCFYDKNLRFGGLVELKDSILKTCNGRWRIYGMQITLESLTPNGRWEAFIKASINENGTINVAK